MSNPKKQLLEYIKNDGSIFDFIQQWAIDGLHFRDAVNPKEQWINPRLWLNLGFESEVFIPQLKALKNK